MVAGSTKKQFPGYVLYPHNLDEYYYTPAKIYVKQLLFLGFLHEYKLNFQPELIEIIMLSRYFIILTLDW